MFPNYCISFVFGILGYFVINILCFGNPHKQSTPKTKPKMNDWNLNLRKFDPSAIWEKYDKQRKFEGKRFTTKEHLDMMFKGMDQVDELMNLEIPKDPDVVPKASRRFGWQPPKEEGYFHRDWFYNRHRLYNLMRQAIYQARSKMIIMQVFREEYRDSPLYKMGFVTNKLDTQMKIFAQFTFRAVRGCVLSYEAAIWRAPLYDMLVWHARQLYHLLNIEILSDLLMENDEVCRRVLANSTVGRKQQFKDKIVS